MRKVNKNSNMLNIDNSDFQHLFQPKVLRLSFEEGHGSFCYE